MHNFYCTGTAQAISSTPLDWSVCPPHSRGCLTFALAHEWMGVGHSGCAQSIDSRVLHGGLGMDGMKATIQHGGSGFCSHHDQQQAWPLTQPATHHSQPVTQRPTDKSGCDQQRAGGFDRHTRTYIHPPRSGHTRRTTP
jgi:hypothetical protein